MLLEKQGYQEELNSKVFPAETWVIQLTILLNEARMAYPEMNKAA